MKRKFFGSMKNKLFWVLFLGIFLIGIFFRFYQLGNVPGSLDWDEASWGYNAYSILLTGKDEYGISYPTSFRAFGEYKLPVYGYIDVVSIAIFGLTDFAVRFPSAFFGSLTTIFVFLLVYELFKKEKKGEGVALVSMFLFAISPWSIQFSRIAFESNLALFFVISAAWLFINGIHKNKNLYLFLATIFFAISAYTYLNEKIFAPLLMVGLVFYGWKFFLKKKILIGALLIFFLLLNSIWIIDSTATTRGKSVLFTSEKTQMLNMSIDERAFDFAHGDKIGLLLHNRRIIYSFQFFENYFSHFNPSWLFITGDNPRHHPPGMGILLFMDLPFILIGMFYVLKTNARISFLLFYWLLIAPIVSALTIESPHASRSIVFLPIWQIFAALGWVILFLSRRKYMVILKTLAVALFIVNVVYFLHQYFIHTNTDIQKDWQFGYKEAVIFANTQKNSAEKIVFAQNIEQAYVFYLFYSKYDPNKYIKQTTKRTINHDCLVVENIHFGSCPQSLAAGDIYITTGKKYGETLREIKRINYSNGESAVFIYQYTL